MGTIVVILILLLAIVSLVWLRYVSYRAPLPPGPPGYPIIGNLFDAPTRMPWVKYRQWSDIYGDIIQFKVFNQRTVVLASAQAAFDLLDKRSDIYSDRPLTIMHELSGAVRWNFGVMRYSLGWRNHRREFHQFFHQHKVPVYQHIQLEECHAFLRRALDDPTQLAPKIRLIHAAIILRIVYGMEISDMHHPYIKIAELVLQSLGAGQIPGTYWVEFLPLLRYIPSWFPGAQFKRFTKGCITMTEKMLDDPFEFVKQNMASGNAANNVAATLLDKIHNKNDDIINIREEERFVRNVIGVAYGAASDTTATATQTFFIAMSLYPDVQRKAQNEVDRVVGADRLPQFDDYNNLIYIQAVILETMRWMPVLPLGVPHNAMADNVYRGLYIPKDTIILINAWAILHDPEMYPEPERFNPDRFIKDGILNRDILDPLSIAFGFGRRICPGRWLSGASLFIIVASVVHTFNIYPVTDSEGMKFDPSKYETEGIMMNIQSIPCTVAPRSSKAEALIRASSAV